MNNCPICNFKGTFKNYRGRRAAYCPKCGALERHRLMWLFFHERTNLFDGQPKRLLHMAPEPCFRHRIPHFPYIDYLTGDLNPKAAKAKEKINLCAIHKPSEHFDVMYCSHILEHIHDDGKAVSEIYRVLRPGGWAVLQVPLAMGVHTRYNPKIRTPQARKREYGQHNHVRQYGSLDYANVLAKPGFQVEQVSFAAEWDQEKVSKFGVSRHEVVHLCTKPLLLPQGSL